MTSFLMCARVSVRARVQHFQIRYPFFTSVFRPRQNSRFRQLHPKVIRAFRQVFFSHTPWGNALLLCFPTLELLLQVFPEYNKEFRC